MFSKFFIERPRFAVVVSLILVIAGILALGKLPVAEYPEIAPPEIYLFASYDGADAESVMQAVAIPLENEINGVEDLLYYSSTCNNSGGYECNIAFKSGTNTDIAMVNVQNAVKRAESTIPPEVIRNGLEVSKRSDNMLAMFAFMTDGTSMNQMELNNFINTTVKETVGRVDGVSSTSVLGAQEYSMRLWLDPLRMAGLSITTQDIANAVSSQNVLAAAGFIGTENSNRQLNYKLNVRGRLKSPDEFGDIVLRKDEDGSIVCLKDVAKVEIGADVYTGRSRYNGEDAVALSIYRSPDSNAMTTVNAVKKVLSEWEQRFPEGVHYESAYDPTEYINVSLKEMKKTLIIALLLVVLITLLFLQNWRATIIPAIAIPVAILGTFPFMTLLGYSINTLTMFGLILVVGSLCDDAIVVVENCLALMERENLSPKEAALKSMKQITGAVLATTLVTVACYVPLFFYGGMVGAIYTQFAATMCIALCLSTVVALTLSPAMCATLLQKPSSTPCRIFKPWNFGQELSRKFYFKAVRALVRRSILTLLLLLVAMGSCVYLFDRTESSFLPDEDKGEIQCDIELPQGASLARTEAVIDEFLKKIEKIPGIKAHFLDSGWSMMLGMQENAGMGIITLADWKERKTPELSQESLMMQLQETGDSIADATFVFSGSPAIPDLGASNAATFQLCGQGEISSEQLGQDVKAFSAQLSGSPEVLYASSAYNASTPQLFFDVDRTKAERLGVEVDSIYSSLQSYLTSYYINDFTLYARNFRVKMQAGDQFRATLEKIREIQVRSNDNQNIPLSSLGDLRFTVGPTQRMRFNKQTSADFSVEANPGVNSARLINLVESVPLPDNYHVEWTGLSYQEKENQGRIIPLLALAMLFAYLFLVAQYESWIIPVPVMLSVIITLTGVLLGLKVSGETLSIYAQLGGVMLIGLAAKNAILMVEFSKQERQNGKSIIEAAENGANLRYRAVMMTAWSFLFGVFPMVVATGAGAQSRQAIGITTFSGMLAATLIGIVFTPALFAVSQRLQDRFTRRRNNPKVE